MKSIKLLLVFYMLTCTFALRASTEKEVTFTNAGLTFNATLTLQFMVK